MNFKFIFLVFIITLQISLSKDYSWVKVDDSGDNVATTYYSAFVFDSLNIFICGTKNFYFPFIRYTSDGGRKWQTSLLDNTVNFTLKDLQLPIKHIFKNSDNKYLAISDSGYYYKTSDLKNWDKKKLAINKYRAVQDASQSNNNIILSYGNRLYLSEDFGDNWNQIYTADSIKNNYLFSEMQFIDDTTIYASARLPDDTKTYYFLHSLDKGKNWYIVSKSPTIINNLKFLDKNIGFYRKNNFEGFNNIYKTNNKGKDWEVVFQLPYENNLFLLGLEFNNNGSAIFANDYSIIFKFHNQFNEMILDSSYYFKNYYKISTLNFITKEKILLADIYGNSFIYTDEDLGTSVENISENHKNEPFTLIFPNPSSDKISLDLGGVALADLVVYDILGNEILSIPNYTNKSEIDISTLSLGTYTIQVQTSTGSISQRFVKY